MTRTCLAGWGLKSFAVWRRARTQERMSEQVPGIPSGQPFTSPWTLAVFLWNHLTLSSHKFLSHPQSRSQLPGCPRRASCGPPPPAPYCSLPAPPHSGTFCLPGPGDCEPLGTGTAQRPSVIPRKSTWNGRGRVKQRACLPSLDTGFQPPPWGSPYASGR